MPCNRKKVSEILVVLAPIPISRPRVKHSALNAHTTQDLLCDSRFSHTIITGWLTCSGSIAKDCGTAQHGFQVWVWPQATAARSTWLQLPQFFIPRLSQLRNDLARGSPHFSSQASARQSTPVRLGAQCKDQLKH